MVDLVIEFFIRYNLAILAAACLFKIFLFLKDKNRNWTIEHFFYFSESNILQSEDDSRESKKKLQNIFSITILLLIIIQVAIFRLA